MTENRSNLSSKPNITCPTTVLLVDDEIDIINEFADYYEENNIRCEVAHSADDALLIIENNPEIGVVVSDIRMPQKNGLELLSSIQKIYNNNRIILTIFLTGHCGANEAIEALRLGAFDFKSKPIDPDHLLHSIQNAIELVAYKTNEKKYQTRLQQEVEAKTIELVKANRIKSEFLSLVNHEIKTPINGIVGFTSLIQSYGKSIDYDELMEMLTDIETSAKHLLSTMESIIDISDSISGKITLKDCCINLHDLFTESIRWQSKKAQDKNINIHISEFDDQISIQGDPLRLIQSIMYLLDNAIIYSPADSEVVIHAKDNDHSVIISIIDRGIGMTEDEIDNALQPFTQIDTGNTRAYEGLGLGLTLSRMLIELHSGNLKISSEINSGTTVQITLPKQFPSQ